MPEKSAVKILQSMQAIERHIIKREYTYSVQDVIDGYKKKKEGWYVSFTMNECIANLNNDLEYLVGVE